ncbi:MAG TPA: response regulator [Desulfobacteraceae bacterium]|nr:response regulator [Desulfobacteraceae bacterium]
MRRNVLLVDDEQEVLQSLQQGLAEYNEVFSIVTAGNGEEAIRKLARDDISLVVTDLKMPNTDGFGLLAHVMESYPDIPVIVMTGYSTSEMEKLASEGGAVGYIAKPFKSSVLAELILTWLRREADGGTLHNVSSGMFLQLIEMEQKTCTIRLSDKASGKRGVLFFRDGELLDARVNGFKGEEAAHHIFSWEEVTLSIENTCRCSEKKIKGELQAILLEAMRLKDEQAKASAVPRKKPVMTVAASLGHGEKRKKESGLEQVKKRLTGTIGTRYGGEKIYYDNAWDGLLGQMGRMGKLFSFGPLKLTYMDVGRSQDIILLPGDKTIMIPVDSKCPRDRMIHALIVETEGNSR